MVNHTDISASQFARSVVPGAVGNAIKLIIYSFVGGKQKSRSTLMDFVFLSKIPIFLSNDALAAS